MNTPPLRAKEGRFAGCIGGRDAILLGWLFTHLLLAVEPHLVYIAGRPVFFLTTEYFFPFLHRSGGCVEWLSLLLAQSYPRDWMGALVLTLEAGAVLALLQATLAALAEEPPRFLRYLPFSVLVMLDTRYDQLAAVGPALIATLAAALLYRRLPAGRRARALGFAALAVAVYYGAAGSFGKLGVVLVIGLFSLLCALFEGRRGRAGLLQAAAYPLLAAGIAFAGEEYLLRYSTPDWGDLLRTPLSWSQGAAVALFGVTALCAAWVAVDAGGRLSRAGRAALDALQTRRSPGAPSPTPAASDAVWRGRLLWLLGTAAVVWATSTAALSLAADATARRAWELEYDTVTQRWEQAINVAEEMAPDEFNMLTSENVNLALFHTGRLARDMFQFPQQWGKMILPFLEPAPCQYMLRQAEVCLELGRVNDAQHVATETMCLYGRSPFVLRQLALVQLAKGQVPAARLFLNTLKGDLVWGGWARRKLALLAKEPGLDSDPEVQGLRRVMLRQDDVQQVQILLGDDKALFLPEQALRHLLAVDKTNRMAFEYLMATYLLQRRLDLLAGEIHRLNDFGDKEIPLLYQQALAIYADDTGKMPDLHGRRLEPGVRWHCRRFASIVGRLGPEKAAEELKKEYGGTYFYYYRFGGEPGR